MNKYLVATLFITLLIGNTFATSTCTVTSGTDGNYNKADHTTATCILSTGAAGVCATEYSDNAPVSGTNTAATAANSALTGDCDYCAPNYIFDSKAHTTCVSTTYASGTAQCAAGYSDVAPSSGVNQAATATGTITGNCDNCAPSYIFSSAAHSACVSTTYASGTAQCVAGYSDVAPVSGVNQAATATGTITGDCDYCAPSYVYGEAGHTSCLSACATGTFFANAAQSECGTVCLTGYSDNAPTGSTNAAASNTAAANCQYCAVGYVFDSKAHTACISTTYNANTAHCATGYSDVAPTSGTNAAASTTTITGNCDYCASGSYWTSTAQTKCGTACDTGYTTATGASTSITADCTVATTTTSGNLLTYTVFVVLAIVSLLF